MLAGRDFLDSDLYAGGGSKVAIVSESYARLLARNSQTMLGRLLSDIDARKLKQVVNVAPVGQERTRSPRSSSMAGDIGLPIGSSASFRILI